MADDPRRLPDPGPPETLPVLRRVEGRDLTRLLDREWLVANGLGGYASGTVGGTPTRRYHGLLVAAHPAPLGRVMMLNHLTEDFLFPDGSAVQVGRAERPGGNLDVHDANVLAEFRLEMGLPVWRYEAHGHVIERRVLLPYQRNVAHAIYRLVEGLGPVRVELRPSVHFRGHHDSVGSPTPEPYVLTAAEVRCEVAGPAPYPRLRLVIDGPSAALTPDGRRTPELIYRVEEWRGYDHGGTLWSPGLFHASLTPGQTVTLTASTESWERTLALSPHDALDAERERRRLLLAAAVPAARDGPGAELVLAADQFIISPAARTEDIARARAAGDEARTIIAGYPWFTDWGRDTMISLEGLTLVTGRAAEARCILRTFAAHVRDGLLPNFFPDHGHEGVYHTADATLWFFHALDRYLAATGDRATLAHLLPVLRDIIAHHQRGTRFGIGVDPYDGLLRQGAQGYQLTWMDAKVGDWVITPRRGKAVEINALWYNALRLTESWLAASGDPAGAAALQAEADRTRDSFNRRFWSEASQHLFDVIDGEDPFADGACRPNQVLAVSLTHPVLDPQRWPAVVETVRRRLLTPVGLRSLDPGHANYKSRYHGDQRSRDAAYHQGTVWAWLIGPFIDAWLRVHPGRRTEARHFLDGFVSHLGEACIGSISEIFDAEAPFTPRGCVAQAWSVAEVLRCWARTAADD